jgi:hypothetical protein
VTVKYIHNYGSLKNLGFLLAFSTLIMIGCQSSTNPTLKNEDSVVRNGIQWAGDGATANYMADLGLNRYITYENSHAFMLSEAAVNFDSSLFASHTLLAFLSKGKKKEYHKKLAKRFVENENENSKLFVSLLDWDDTNDESKEQRRTIWTKMHGLTNDPFVHYMYIRYMDKDESEKILGLNKLISFCSENGFNYVNTAANNMKAYMLIRQGNLKEGISAIEASMEFHTEGYNHLDSRDEFYLYAGDNVNAINMCKKVLEKFPYAQNAHDHLEKLVQKSTD